MKSFPKQSDFFERIKAKLPPHLSLAEEIAALLDVSADSAYRRIRCETALSLEEAFLLSETFGVPVATAANDSQSQISFAYQSLAGETFGMKYYLQRILEQIRRIHAAAQKQITYNAKDIPLFHFFHVPEVASFKMFFWSRYVYRLPGTENQKFSLTAPDKDSSELGKRVLEFYNGIPTRELWNEETVQSTLRQIKYCREAGVIATKQDAWSLLDRYEELLTHIQKQADLGYKFSFAKPENGTPGNYQLFLNEMLIGDNSILVETDGQIQSFIPHNTLDYLVTSNESFGKYSMEKINSLLKASTLISGVSEKDRSRFFLNIAAKISETRNSLN